ncbi:hypothetical protein [Oricola sp.]|uniref:hypothetical protein n=1 Tax=Oricola sp. TaxID=1979950 RepID=UPI0035197902
MEHSRRHHEEPALSRRETFSAAFLASASVLVLVDKVSGRHSVALVALVMVLLPVVTSWRRIGGLSRLMSALAIIATLAFALTGGTLAAFLLAASRALFLPALLVMMTILQASAQNSEPVARVARFVVDQPPSRRFAMLTIAGHIFGMLLNLAGFRFLLAVALDQCRQMTSDADVLVIKERRVVNAVLCGFGATIMWSPVGIALNLLLPLMPDFDWIDYAPYGICTVLVFVGLRFLFDSVGPRPMQKREPASRKGVVRATLQLIALLIGVTGGAALADVTLGIPMQGALLIVVPLAAIIWRLWSAPGPALVKLADLATSSFRAMPKPVNEVSLVLATGYLGLILVELIPMDSVRSLIGTLDLSPAGLCAVIVLLIAAFSMVGVSPMITGTVCVGAVLGAGLDIPYPMLLLSALTGWAVGMMLSPVTATMIVTSAISGRPASQVGWRWNGAFTITFTVLMLGAFTVWGWML